MSVLMHLKTRIHNTLSKLGVSNGSAPPNSQDPMDARLHEYFVADEMRAYADKRAKLAKEDLLMDTHVTAEVNKLADMATKSKMKTSDTVVRAQHYTLQVSCNSPVVSIDSKKLIIELQSAGVKQDIIDKAIKAATKTASPAKSFEVIANG